MSQAQIVEKRAQTREVCVMGRHCRMLPVPPRNAKQFATRSKVRRRKVQAAFVAQDKLHRSDGMVFQSAQIRSRQLKASKMCALVVAGCFWAKWAGERERGRYQEHEQNRAEAKKMPNVERRGRKTEIKVVRLEDISTWSQAPHARPFARTKAANVMKRL